MTRFLTTIVFIVILKTFVFGQKNEEFTIYDIKNTRWSYKRYLSEIKIGDKIEFKKSSYQHWKIKFKSNGRIIETDTFTDYSGKRFIRKKYKAGEWKLKGQILLINMSKSIYHLKFMSKDKNSIKFIVNNIVDN